MENKFYNTFNFDIVQIKNHLDSTNGISKKITYLSWLQIEVDEKYHFNYKKFVLKMKDYKGDEISKHIVHNLFPVFIDEKGIGEIKTDITPDLLTVTGFLPTLEPLIKFIKKSIEFWKDQLIIQKQNSIDSKINLGSESKSNPKDTKAKNRIEWLLSQTDLIDFFEIMKFNNLITEKTYKDMNVIIRDCFTDENGKDFDNQQIAMLKNQKAKKSKNFFKLEKTITDFKKRKPSS